MSEWRKPERIALVALLTAIVCYAIYQYVKTQQEPVPEIKQVEEAKAEEQKVEETGQPLPAEPEPAQEPASEPVSVEQEIANRKQELKEVITPIVANEIKQLVETLRSAHAIPADSKTRFNENMQMIEADIMQQISSALNKMSDTKVFAADPRALANAFVNAAKQSIGNERKSFLANMQHRDQAIRAALNAETPKVISETSQLTGVPKDVVAKIITPFSQSSADWVMTELRAKDPLGLIDRFATSREAAVQMYHIRLGDLYKHSAERPVSEPLP